jgi:hypothetical protein
MADALAQLIADEVVSRVQRPVATASLGLVFDDLQAAMERRHARGFLAPAAVVPSLEPRPRQRPGARRYRMARDLPPGMRRCARCETVKPEEQFSVKDRSRGVYRSYCVPCWKDKQRERRLTVRKLELLNQVGVEFVAGESDELVGLVCATCGGPIEPGQSVHGSLALTHDDCPERGAK